MYGIFKIKLENLQIYIRKGEKCLKYFDRNNFHSKKENWFQKM